MSSRIHPLLTPGLLLACALLAGAAAGSPFRNVVNKPFASVSNGPQGAIVVYDDAAQTAATGMNGVRSAVAAQHSPQGLRRAQRTLRWLQRHGLKSPRAHLAFPRRVVHVKNGRIVAPDLMHAAQTSAKLGEPTNELRFTFEGFNDTERTQLQAYLDRALPKAYTIYGRPAFDLDVKIVLDPTLQVLQGGIYDAAANEIRMATLSGNLPEDTYVLMILVLYAFHDDAAFFYDAWEEGFAGAAATAIQTTPGVMPGYNPIDPGPFYATSVYEPQNQRDLGGPTFYPASGFRGMLVWRVAMARSAWFKCYIEDNDFFRRFNAAYYAAFDDTLAGDVPRLRVIGAGVLPQVEGMPFQEWFQRQCVLDTSERLGPKLFVWNIPLTDAVALIAEHFFSLPGGDEQPRGGQARTIYWSYDFAVSLYAEEGNIIDIPSTGPSAGEGFLIPTFFNVGGPQNITVQVDLDGLRLMLPYPYAMRGFELGENNLYGSIVGATTGSVDVTGGRGIDDASVTRSVWGGRITQGDLTPQQLTVTFTNPLGQTVTRVVNVAWDSYVLFLHGGGQIQLNHTFSAADGGLHLFSLPLRPLTSDLAALFGIAPDRLLVARWDPTSGDTNKYQIWPRTDPPIPGRGYWLRVFEDVDLSLTGVLEPETSPYVVPLKAGWNQIGSPRQDPVNVADLKIVPAGEQPMTWQEAVDAGIVQDGIYGWTALDGYAFTDTLVPFAGYWVRCMRAEGALLRFEPVSGTAGVRPKSVSPADDLSWRLRIMARAGKMRCTTAWLGAAESASDRLDRHDLQSPPSFGPGVTVRFIPPGASAPYLTDVRSNAPRRQRWQVHVASSLPLEPVRLSWPDLSQLPADLRPLLVDTATGRRIYMRTSSGYTIPAGRDGVQRKLRVVIDPDRPANLTITSLSARQGRGSAQIVFTLSAGADTDVTVLNIAGRAVRRLPLGVCEAGINSATWNLRDDGGHLIPAGLYLVQVHARDDTGQQTQSLGTMLITR
ncbi:MAG: hypothetical protein J7M38_01230 [Armatimonadetes bacterium]|nr:hypothetical protein [Armatimonadota bacterium]